MVQVLSLETLSQHSKHVTEHKVTLLNMFQKIPDRWTDFNGQLFII